MEPNLNQATPTSFWRRQFSDSPTLGQTIFDVTAGVIVPTLCLIFDPIVFKSKALLTCYDGTPPNLLTPERLVIFAYSLIGLGMLALMIWLIAGSRLGHGSAFFAGIFFAGAESAFVFGITILPFSLIGLLAMGLGLLGFTPFLTAIVYLRNGIRAWRMARQQKPVRPFAWLLAIALTATLAVYVVPAYIQWQAWVSFPQTRIIATPPPCGRYND